MDDDGFVTVSAGRGHRLHKGEVSFSGGLAFFPEEVAAHLPQRATWACNGNGVLRARFADDGALSVAHRASYRSYSVAAAALLSFTGLDLRGRYPIAKVEGNDVFIDVSREMSGEEGGTA